MSQNTDSYGYGVDIGYTFRRERSIDFEISDSGDIALVGGSPEENMDKKRKNAIQQIVLRILTPFGGLSDESGSPIPFGSEIQAMIGAKDTSLNRQVMKAYVLTCLQDYRAIEAILNIEVIFPKSGVCEIKIMIKLKDDDKVLYETITIGSV